MNWRVIAIQVHPSNGYLYALTEGRGLFGSADQGDHWTLLSGNVAFALLLDANYPNRIFGSTFSNPDGQYGGASFEQIGLPGVTISGLALNGDSIILYLAVQKSGIVTSRIPSSAK